MSVTTGKTPVITHKPYPDTLPPSSSYTALQLWKVVLLSVGLYKSLQFFVYLGVAPLLYESVQRNKTEYLRRINEVSRMSQANVYRPIYCPSINPNLWCYRPLNWTRGCW
jgi:hypothetical protein